MLATRHSPLTAPGSGFLLRQEGHTFSFLEGIQTQAGGEEVRSAAIQVFLNCRLLWPHVARRQMSSTSTRPLVEPSPGRLCGH